MDVSLEKEPFNLKYLSVSNSGFYLFNDSLLHCKALIPIVHFSTGPTRGVGGCLNFGGRTEYG